MQKLSLRKQLSILRLYLGGFSFDEIATRAGVSKGTVSNVIADLKAGQFPEVGDVAEQIDALRELAIDLRRCRLTPGQSVAGLAVLSRLQELGVEPADIERWTAMCRELAAQETGVQAFVQAALSLEELRERTGLGAEALEEKVRGLEEEVARLEPLVQELKGCQQELEELEEQRQGLADEVSQLEKRHQPLQQSVTQKERREAELSHRVQDLEQRAQAADERLATARREVQVLAGLGLSLDNIPGFAQRVSGVAQRHHIEPDSLLERLLHELEQLEECLGLEAAVKMKRHQLNEAQQAVVKAQEERAALEAVVQRLRRERAALHAAMTEEQSHVRKEIRAFATIAKDNAAELKRDLRNGLGKALLEVQKLRDQAFELGQELGSLTATIEANQWLQTLVALVKGDGGVSAADVRLVGLTVLRGVKSWLQENQSQISLPFGLTMRVDWAIEELERWKV